MWPTAVLLGDSQTQLAWEAGGWAQSLAEKFVRKIDIINRGFSGYNTRMIHTTLPDALSQDVLKRAKIVCIFLGSNDASIGDKNPEQAVPVEEFGENLLRFKLTGIHFSTVLVSHTGTAFGTQVVAS